MKPCQDHSDMELLALLRHGQDEAFEIIYKRYVADLYRFARKNVTVSEDCEEIIQDIFESLWLRRSSLEHITELRGYLFGMVKYKVIRYFQHQAVKKRYAEHFKLFEAVYDSMAEHERDPEHIQRMIEQTLLKLPERCQLAVRLRLTENLSNSDIAKRMNIKKSTVENYMVTALNHLRAAYQNIYKAG